MTRPDLVIDLRGRRIETLSDFWDAVMGPCMLPSWFGRNLDAWRDLTESVQGGLSDHLERHDKIVIRADAKGLFAPGNRHGSLLMDPDGQKTRWEISG
ncbi:barstar family protein [Kitasatospora sp. NPDC057223]|uniref:barstar family protein n=1 Tax=Kitasatospora sp. NPDC057223 TaxID=3346055 RepID=UPI0036285906